MSDSIENKAKTEADAIELMNHTPIMIKFQLYGFLKNLQFFEPFLLLIFLGWGLDFFTIGLLMTIREVFTYLFEIPSGIIADSYGKKNELLLCFVFYIISFLFYFFGPNIGMLVIASMFYGLGEAFRSGTHKAMEMEWMEREEIIKFKSLIYGKTRSWSLYGSALNSVGAILLVLFIPADHWIFIFAIIPFAIDFVLIASYPSYMNEKREGSQQKWTKEFRENIKNLSILVKSKRLRQGILTSSTYDAVFKTLKDYIQPIMKGLIGVLIIDFALQQYDADLVVKFALGIIYAIFYLLSSFASQNAYRVEKLVKNQKKALDILFDVFAILLLLESIFIWVEVPLIIVILYLLIYMIYNIRRPMVVGYIGELSPKSQRATVLSVESQMKSIFVFIFAPVFGLIADYFSIAAMFIVIAIIVAILNHGIFWGECGAQAEEGVCED